MSDELAPDPAPEAPPPPAPAPTPRKPLAPAEVICLTCLDDIWILKSGRANIFATPLRDAMPLTARRLLFTIEAPGIVFGMPEQADDLLFEAIIDPGGEVEAVTRDMLFSRESGEHREKTIAGVSQWFENWSAGCARMIHSRPPRDLASDEDIVVGAGHVFDSVRELSWRRVGYGSGAMFDLMPVGGYGIDLIPIAPGGWVRAFEPMRLVPITTAQLFNRGALNDAVRDAQVGLGGVVRIAIGLEQADEGLRRGRRAAQIDADTRRVMGDLGRMVGAEAPYKVDAAANRNLFSAIYLLADRLGVRARPPSAVRQAEAELEPSLEEILRASGLQSRPVRLGEGWPARGMDEMLAYYGEDRQPVALLRDRRGRYHIHIPASGEALPLDAAHLAALAEDAHVLYQPLPDKPIKLRDLLFFGTQRSLPDFLTLVGAALLGAFLASTPSMASRVIFEMLIPQHLTGLLLQAGIALALFALISGIFVFSGTISMSRIRARASSRLKAALWDRVLRQPMGFLQRYTAPDLTMRIQTAENIVAAFHMTAYQSMVTAGYLIVNIATMVWLAPGVAAVAIPILGVLALVTWFAAVAQKKAFSSGEAAEGSTTTFVHALTNGVRKLRLAGAEERAFVKWADRFTRSRMKLINVRKVTNRYGAFVAGYSMLALSGLFVLIGQLSTTQVGVGSFFGFITAFTMSSSSLATLGRQILQLAFQIASIPYIQPLLDNPPPLQSKKSNPGELSGGIEVLNLSFAYGPDSPVSLAGVSFSAAPGEFVAIVGPSGSGKSTMLKMLLGLETPLSGAVLYDQHDLASLDLDTVRQQIGVVMQRPQLMPTSIFENLRGVTECGMDEIWEAAEQAGIADEIRAMPMGMHTIVTEGSQTISGGQRQRLALARALARKPAVLLLDEATSALDNQAQSAVMGNLAHLGCTRIVVAHRLSTVINADNIIVLDKGRIVEAGTYSSLMSSAGLFSRLVSGQLVE
ncbi:ATP-binding cassette domain-containing protein [Sphingomonas naphthae]|uniref:ATP-binding cassette domain-containing protein n=1 Tax=Sphingomonas naphthae TaxID=1813468 RepID=A0ABY7TN56_9SPHN|nr:ATP-binding cassette domain-containing protein [Sphingomonas naphthae]WCT74171.1 ATP-binding cassette domain-containing protein [Sphingomonas naphthae]